MMISSKAIATCVIGIGCGASIAPALVGGQFTFMGGAMDPIMKSSY